MLLEMNRNAVFPLVNMEMEAFEQTLSLQKDGDGGFCKNTSYWYSCINYNLMKGNKILQPNILIYFNTIFYVIQRTVIVR